MIHALQQEAGTAARLLGLLQPQFDRAVGKLARLCTSGTRLQSGLLDTHLVAAYELAWSSAELLATRTVLARLDADSSIQDARLALIFAVEAIAAVLARLEPIFLELDLELAALHSIAGDPGWARLRHAVAGAQALAATGRALAQGDQEVGRVPLDQELRIARDTFRRFAAEVVAPQAGAIHRQNLTVPESLLQPLRALGVFGLSIPECYGGSATSDVGATRMMVVVTEALSEASLAAAGSLITRPEILSRALLAGATEAQKRRWLPQIAAGDPLCAIEITEPDFGSDVANLALQATPARGGWLLDGAKTWCTFAGKAGLLMVVARTDADRTLGHRGLSVLLVEKPSYDTHSFGLRQPGGGSLQGRAIPTIGYRGMHSFDLAFENFFVPDEHVIGGAAGLGKGFYYTMAGMTGGRLQTAARATGVMRAALLAALRYATERKVFGAPLIGCQLTLAKLARMAARLAACRQLTYAVAGAREQGDARIEASLVKLLACRSAELVTREALQIHGGMGYAEEVPVSRYFVDARVLSIFEGAEETLALKVIARSLLEQALAREDG